MVFRFSAIFLISWKLCWLVGEWDPGSPRLRMCFPIFKYYPWRKTTLQELLLNELKVSLKSWAAALVIMKSVLFPTEGAVGMGSCHGL